LPMLLAEELDINLDVIQIVAAPVGDAYINPENGGQVTGTSNSVQDAWDKLRMAGATARTCLFRPRQALAGRSGPVSCQECLSSTLKAKVLTYASWTRAGRSPSRRT